MTRALAIALLLAACSEQSVSPIGPPHWIEPPPELPPAPPPPLTTVCTPFEARALTIAAAERACATDADCTCRSGLFFDDCGAATTMDVARQLDDVLRDAALAGCTPGGRRCGPRACEVECHEGRCRDHVNPL